jgi:type I restriction enzyme, S subunit
METTARLGDIVTKIEENEWNKSELLRAGYERFVKVEHMDAEDLRIHRWGSVKDDLFPPTFHKVFRKGQILLPTRNPHLRRVVIADFDGICGEKTLTLSPIENKIEPNLVAFILQSDDFVQHCINSIIGSTNPHIRWRDIAKYEIDLPERTVQKRITKILLSIESTIEKIEHIIQVTEILKRGLLENLLTKGINHKKFKKTELGEIPEEWETVFLGDKKYFQLRTGGTPSTNNSEYWKAGIPWLTSGELNRKRIFYTEKEISNEGFLNANATNIPIDSSLIALAGQGKTRGTVGINKIELTTNQSVAAVIPTREFFNASFLYHLLDSRYEYLRRISGGTGRAGLSLKILSEIAVPLPKLSEQEEISGVLEQADSSLSVFREHYLKSMNLKKKVVNLFLCGKLVLMENYAK